MGNSGEQFLHQKDSELHTSQPVEHEVERQRAKGESVSQKPADKIYSWLKLVEDIHTKHREDPTVFERIKDYYHKEYVIKAEDVPESAFLLEQRVAREQGYGTIEITDEFRKRKSEQIILDQEESLDKWVNYLSSKDAAYPMWAKYWVFNSMVQMGKFEKSEKEENGEKKEFGRFTKRTQDSVAAFPPLNPRALAMTIDTISSKVEEDQKPKTQREPLQNTSIKLSANEFQELLTTERFSKIYAQFLIEMPEYSNEGLQETRGKWVKYEKGSDPKPLVDSLEGHPLEWCTAGLDTARSQLQGGDFYVYYSINSSGEAKIPRIAIRMEGDSIGEIRGIAPNQNLDPYIGPVLEKKLKDFPDGESYKNKTADMQRVTLIETKVQKKEELSKEDLRFMYEIDSKIEGFGYKTDPRIEEILSSRDMKSDLSLATGYSKEQISTTETEALSGGIKFHYGNIYLPSLTSAEGLTLPDSIGGGLYLRSLTSAEGLTLPKSIGGSLYLPSLTSAEGLTLPDSIGGDLGLSSLTSAEGLTLPKSIKGYLNLPSLTSAEGLTLPDSIGGGLYLRSLTSAEGLTLPKSFGGYLALPSLTSAEGLTLPKSIKGDLYLPNLTSAERQLLRIKYPYIF
jgi:hypothetical protein